MSDTDPKYGSAPAETGSSGTGWTYGGNTYTIGAGGTYLVRGTSRNGNRLVVADYVRATVMLDNVVIDLSSGYAITLGNNAVLTVYGVGTVSGISGGSVDLKGAHITVTGSIDSAVTLGNSASLNLNGVAGVTRGSLTQASGSPVLTFAGNVITVAGNGGHMAVNDLVSTSGRIAVSSGTSTITLNGVNIDLSTAGGCPIDLQDGANVTLVLSGENTLKSGGDRTYSDDVFGTRKPGVLVPEGASLTITSSQGAGSESGVLTATAKVSGAGIGGEFGGTVGAISIEGGTIYATGGWNDISGGTNSKFSGAGIGGGGYTGGHKSGENGYGVIEISGGKIVAVSVSQEDKPAEYGIQYGGAGIGGGGYNQGGGTITITGGDITATSVYSPRYSGGGSGAAIAGIGGGGYGNSGNITINGGKGTSTGSYNPGGGGGASRAVGPGYVGTAGVFTLNGTSRPGFPTAGPSWSWDASAGTVSDEDGCGAWNNTTP
jgi:hypothetical protein